MLRFFLTRFSLIIPTFIGMTLVAFFLIRMVPGDPIEVRMGERGITPERLLAFLRGYVLFDRKVGKIVARYQQFGAAGQASKIKAIPLQEIARQYSTGELSQIVQ